MDTLLTIIIVLAIVWVILKLVSYASGSTQAPPPPQGTFKQPTTGYRPTTSTARSRVIKFDEPKAAVATVFRSELAGLVDAFTGEPLNLTLGLFQCARCKVYYHKSSFDVIRSENAGRCVACLDSQISTVNVTRVRGTPPPSRPTHVPTVVTLANYREHVGRVITFEGYVVKLLVSRRGLTYAAMFEDKSWRAGLKMVILRGRVHAVGGPAFIGRFLHNTVRVRGLLQRHPKYGYQILVTERSMIQDIR